MDNKEILEQNKAAGKARDYIDLFADAMSSFTGSYYQALSMIRLPEFQDQTLKRIVTKANTASTIVESDNSDNFANNRPVKSPNSRASKKLHKKNTDNDNYISGVSRNREKLRRLENASLVHTTGDSHSKKAGAINSSTGIINEFNPGSAENNIEIDNIKRVENNKLYHDPENDFPESMKKNTGLQSVYSSARPLSGEADKGEFSGRGQVYGSLKKPDEIDSPDDLHTADMQRTQAFFRMPLSAGIINAMGAQATPGNVEGYRASGDTVVPGKNYVVGEKGPEILNTGSASGNIVPNEKLGGNASPVITINNNVTIKVEDGGVNGSFADKLKKALDEMALTEFRAKTGL